MGTENQEKIIALLDQYAPRQANGYINISCPACNKKAYLYADEIERAGVFAKVRCSHSSCAIGKDGRTILEQFDLQGLPKNEGIRILKEDQVGLYENHGLDLWSLVESKILDKYGYIILGEHNGSIIRKELGKIKQNGSWKWVWKAPRKDRWKKEKGSYYRPVHTREDVLWIFDGEWDWLKGIQDGLACTSSIYGCKHMPIGNDWAIFAAFQVIKIVPDLDANNTGVEAAGKLSIVISEKFAGKRVEIVRLPFKEGETGKDYCDWRKGHQVAELLIIEGTVVDSKETKADKEHKKLTTRKQRATKKGKEFSEVIKRIDGEEKSFLVTDNGVFSEVVIAYGSGSFLEYKRICSTPVQVISNLTDLCSKENYVKLSWGCGQEHEITVIMQTKDLWTKSMDKLSSVGIKVLSKNSNDLSAYFLSAIDDAPTSFFSTRNGWIGKDFVIGNLLINEKGKEIEIERRDDNVKLGRKGSEEKWLEAIKPFIESDPQTQIACGASTIAPLLEPLNIPSFTTHISGDSSKGKTVSSTIAASFWGSPKTGLHAWWGSVTAHELYFYQMQNIPCFLEESQECSSNTIKGTVYHFGNSRGKSRGTVVYGGISLGEQLTWNTSLVSTGENKLSDSTSQGGLAARAIEIEKQIFRYIDDETVFIRLERTLNSNYGHGGPKIIKYFLDQKEMLYNKYEDMLISLIMYCKKNGLIESNIQKRILKSWSAVILGCQINKSIFGLEYNSKDIMEEICKSFQNMENSKPSDNLYSFLIELYTANIRRFYVSNMGQTDYCEETEIWGLYDKDIKVIYFFPNILRREMSKHGFSWSTLSFLKEEGKIICDKDTKRLQTRKTISGQRTRVIAIKQGMEDTI